MATTLPRLTAVLASLFAVQTAPTAKGATLSGVVMMDGGSNPMAWPFEECNVRLLSVDRVLEIRSDKGGRFQFANLTPGRFELEITSPGFIPSLLRNLEVTEPMNSLAVSLRMANIPDHCGPVTSTRYGLPRSGATELSVVVLEWPREEKPLKKSRVAVFSPGASSPIAVSLTDSTGRAYLKGLPPGRYDLRVTHSGYYRQNIMRILVPKENSVLIRCSLEEERESFNICQ